MMGVCVLYCKQYALGVLFVIEKPIIHIYCRGRWDLVLFWEIYVKPVTKVFVLEWAVYWWIIPVLQLSFFQIWSSYVLSAEPTTNMPSDETLLWLVTWAPPFLPRFGYCQKFIHRVRKTYKNRRTGNFHK
jgi:hypothetical protein